MCHGELARRRPPPQFLTGYYMWISFGGMIGGILTGLVAPQIFSRIIEYPLLVVLTLLCRPGFVLPTRGSGQICAADRDRRRRTAGDGHGRRRHPAR